MDTNKSLADANKNSTEDKDNPQVNANEQPQQPAQDQQKQTPESTTKETTVQQHQPPTMQAEVKDEHKQKTEPNNNGHGIKFNNPFSRLKLLKIANLRSKLGYIFFEYKRVLSLARKPTRREYRELAIMVIVGTFIIGGIGFLVQMLIQFI